MQLSDIITTDELKSRAAALCRKKVKAGYDHMSAFAASQWMQVNADVLRQELLAGHYQPMPAVGFYVAQMTGKRRLARLTAIDTIVQQVLLDALAPLCEEEFSDSSYAYRKRRGVSSALEMYCLVGAKNSYAAKIDLRSCFDMIRHDVLEQALCFFFPDDEIRRLLMKMVQMPVYIDREIIQPMQGVIQGAPLSPMLCNIYLHSLDVLLSENGAQYIRYGDDLVIFSKEMDTLKSHLTLARDHVEKNLGLLVNDRKMSMCSPASLSFLGCVFERTKRNTLVAISEEAHKHAYHAWHTSAPAQPRRSAEILSDGILRQRDFSILFDNGDEEINIPIATTQAINVYSNVVMDSGFLSRVMKKGMCVNLFDQHDHLVGRFTPERPLHAPKITFEQLEFYYNTKKRIALAKKFVLAAIHHQQLNIRYYNRHNRRDEFAAAIYAMDEIEKQIRSCDSAEKLLLLEARAKEKYYECFDFFIKADNFAFEHRSRRPPHNEVNALLSFGNMVLYNQLASIINQSPLDIRVGCVHSTNRRKESLNLDFADVYKPLIVDRTALALINRRALRPYHFEYSDDGGMYLTAVGKQIFLDALYDKLADIHQIDDRKMSYRSIMAEDVQAFVRFFRNGERYKPFRQVK